MTEMSPREVRRVGRLIVLVLPLYLFAVEFALLLVTYLVLARIAGSALGEVAVSPARFAGWIALVRLPMTLVYWLVVSRHGWMAMVTTGEVPDPPALTGWRRTLVRVRDWGAGVGWSVLAALIVFNFVADPGDVQLWQLIAVTAVGPVLLWGSLTGLFRLLRWWWRRERGHHASPDEEPAHARTQAE